MLTVSRVTPVLKPMDAGWPAWPTYGLAHDLLPALRDWRDSDRRVALATLVRIEGSSPRPLGSEMAINDAGDIIGYVSGGCVEAAVAAEAEAVIESGRPSMLDYGAGSPVLDVQLTCGGRIGIFVRALPDLSAYVAALETARLERRALDVHIDLTDGTHGFIPAPAARDSFCKTYLPSSRLIVAGSDPVTLALCHLAPQFGYETALLRPYGPGAPPPACTLFHYDTRPLSTAVADQAIDSNTAVYTLTHDMRDDHTMLAHALRSPAFSIGALGSRRKSAQRMNDLRAEGFDDAALNRLTSPAGLNIDAHEPAEIALSILAELVAKRPRETNARS